MKQVIARLLILTIFIAGGWLWLLPPEPAPAEQPTLPVSAAPRSLGDIVTSTLWDWFPAVLLLSLMVLLLALPAALFYHLRNRHKIAQIEAQQPIPRHLDRLSYHAGSKSLALRNYDEGARFVPELPPPAMALASVNLANLLHTFRPSVDRIFIGTSAQGPVYRSLPQLMHVGLLGSSNSGKSTAQLAMAVQMAMLDQARLTILDPQAKTFSKLRHSPKLLLPFPMDDRDCVDNLQALQDILAEREAQIKKVGAFDWYEHNQAYSGDLFPIFNFVDELPVLASIPDAVDALMDLARRGRAYGLYLVLAGQGFRREDIGNTAIRQQITTKFVLRCGEEAQVRPIGGIPPEMVQMAVQFDKPGMAIFRPDDGEAQIIRLPYIAPADAERLLGVQTTLRGLTAPDPAATITLEQHDSALETPRSARSASEHPQKPPESQAPRSASNALNASLAEALGITPEERSSIILLGRVKTTDGKRISRREISRQVYGTDGGPAFQKVKAVLDAEGL